MKTPDEQLAELHQKRMELAKRRHGVDAAVTAAGRVLDEAAGRRRVVLVAEARGNEPAETLEQIEQARRVAEVAVAEGRERSAAIRTVEVEVGDEVNLVIDAHPSHFLEQAAAASEQAGQAIAAARDAAQAAAASWMDARTAWGTVRASRRRRGLEMGPEVPVSDFGNAVHELSESVTRPYPGGSRERWQEFLAHEQRVARIEPSRQADSAPLLERIG